MLDRLRAQWPNGRGVREFVRILKLHRDHSPDLVAQAVEQALVHSCGHADGVELCLRQLEAPGTSIAPMDLTRWPELMAVGAQSLDLQCYDRLLEGV